MAHARTFKARKNTKTVSNVDNSIEIFWDGENITFTGKESIIGDLYCLNKYAPKIEPQESKDSRMIDKLSIRTRNIEGENAPYVRALLDVLSTSSIVSLNDADKDSIMAKKSTIVLLKLKAAPEKKEDAIDSGWLMVNKPMTSSRSI